MLELETLSLRTDTPMSQIVRKYLTQKQLRHLNPKKSIALRNKTSQIRPDFF